MLASSEHFLILMKILTLPPPRPGVRCCSPNTFAWSSLVSWVLLLGLAFGAPGVGTDCPAFAGNASRNRDFDRFLDKVTTEWVKADPQSATLSQYFKGAEQDALDQKLTPITRAYRAERVATARHVLEGLKGFDTASLTPEQKISSAALAFQLNEILSREPFEESYAVFDQFHGLHVRLVSFLSQFHPIRSRRDIENYLVRLGQVAERMDEGIAQTKDREARGIPLMPRFILTSVNGQFDRFLDGGTEKNVLVTSLIERSANVKGLSAEKRDLFVATAKKIVTDSILPAYRRAQQLLQAQMSRATDDAGVWRFPNGEKLYAQALRQLTTTDYTAQQIHEIGLKEVARIESEMEGLLRQKGYKEGSIKARMEKLNKDLQPQPDGSQDPRPQLIQRYKDILSDAQKRAKGLFDLRPKAPCTVLREPAFTEKTAAAHYTPPAKDGTRPGVFWAPLPGPFEMVGMRTLVYHEAIPGHHFQVALEQENTALPRFQRDRAFGFNSAYGEGWALYAEHLAAENQWYEGDIVGRLGQLDAELFRARRLVVDTGIHTMKWTRQQAIDYGIRPSEVERYVVWPGQACSYKIGMLKILELRERARKELGSAFDIKAFHNVLLKGGSLPLSVLEVAVENFISEAKQKRK